MTWSNFLENFGSRPLSAFSNAMTYQQLMIYLAWHQSCFRVEREQLAVCRYLGVLQVHARSKPFGWARRAETQGAGAWRPTLPNPYPGARESVSGPGPARMAAAVGLVSPPGGIVLWDEWHAALKSKGGGKPLENSGRAEASAKDSWRRPPKEVREDRNHK